MSGAFSLAAARRGARASVISRANVGQPRALLPDVPRSLFRTCQWIAGEPSADDACKCGAPTWPDSNYCPRHHEIAYQPGTSYAESERRRKAGKGTVFTLGQRPGAAVRA